MVRRIVRINEDEPRENILGNGTRILGLKPRLGTLSQPLAKTVIAVARKTITHLIVDTYGTFRHYDGSLAKRG